MNVGFEGLALIIGIATLFSFIAKKTKQPTVIAYIATGLILGPVGLNLLNETELTSLFSELGLVFLLFFIGLEIDISKIREVFKPTIIIGVVQMTSTFVFGVLIGLILGFSTIEIIFLGAAAMFSSTALVVKMLTDKDEASSLTGRLDIGILLVQDIAVVLILAMLTVNFTTVPSLITRFLEIILMVLFIGGLSVASSRYILPGLFKKISENEQNFFIYGLAWAFILITGAQYLSLSVEIGAFFAGLSIAQLPYSSELQERVRPLTDLFMAVFFVNFGIQIVPEQLSAYFYEAIVASILLIIGKFLILFNTIDRLKFTPETSFKSSINMTQISEFSLILGALAVSEGFIGDNFLGFISLIAITTMGLSSYLLNYNTAIYSKTKHIVRRFSKKSEKEEKVHKLEGHAVVIGYNLITERILPLINQHYEDVVIIDKDPENTDKLSKSNYTYIYGDFRHGEIRKSSNLKDAKLIISISNDQKVNRQILRDKKRETTAFLQTRDFEQAADLYERGAEYVILENVVSAEKMSDYLELYLKDPKLFEEEVQDDLETIHWGGRNG